MQYWYEETYVFVIHIIPWIIKLMTFFLLLKDRAPGIKATHVFRKPSSSSAIWEYEEPYCDPNLSSTLKIHNLIVHPQVSQNFLNIFSQIGLPGCPAVRKKSEKFHTRQNQGNSIWVSKNPYHAYWCPGSLCHQDINGIGIEYAR